jgi:hypothetical protein
MSTSFQSFGPKSSLGHEGAYGLVYRTDGALGFHPTLVMTVQFMELPGSICQLGDLHII